MAAEFATDATGCSRNQHHLTGELRNHLLHVDVDFVAPQQVFNAKFRDTTVHQLAVLEFVHGRQHQHAYLGFGAIAHQTILLIEDIALFGKQDVLDATGLNHLRKLFVTLGRKQTITGYANGSVAIQTDVARHLVTP
ncbi:hypothetical protein SDC9_101023 [bioreactor metagenome]|uniref:Uncharacterized protein n=1 Tax=bioreactor metagenome TaxID=1076179 RepID=A0A645ANA4_9ZZZZ